MLTAEELLEYAEGISNDKAVKISLIFIMRELKPGMRSNTRAIDKYDFNVKKVSLSSDVSDYFKSVLSNQIITHSSREDIEVKPYTVIDDDIDNKIYTYALNNALSFSKVVTEHVKSDKISSINSLEEIKDNLWAYCIKVYSNKRFAYSFRKFGKSRITTDTPEDIIKKFTARFDKSDSELRPFDGSAISFDDKIDCLYLDEQFYVFKKKSFEAIVGLEDEFHEVAHQSLESMKSSDIVVGLEIIENEMIFMPSVRKTMTSIRQKGNDKDLSKEEVHSMNDVLKKFDGVEFTINAEGKIVLENTADARNFLKLLNDYYKQGMTTKKYYATDSGSLVSPRGNN